jgi:hypothetical protein
VLGIEFPWLYSRLFCVAQFPSAELSLDDTRTQLRIRKWILVYALFVFDSLGKHWRIDIPHVHVEHGIRVHLFKSAHNGGNQEVESPVQARKRMASLVSLQMRELHYLQPWTRNRDREGKVYFIEVDRDLTKNGSEKTRL